MLRGWVLFLALYTLESQEPPQSLTNAMRRLWCTRHSLVGRVQTEGLPRVMAPSALQRPSVFCVAVTNAGGRRYRLPRLVQVTRRLQIRPRCGLVFFRPWLTPRITLSISEQGLAEIIRMGDTVKLFDEDVGPEGTESIINQDIPRPQVRTDSVAAPVSSGLTGPVDVVLRLEIYNCKRSQPVQT